DGDIVIRSLRTGERITSRNAENRADIYCLAFQRDARRRQTSRPLLGDWLLAAGDASGTVTIWDLNTDHMRSICRNLSYHVYAVAFSPDGMTLAAAGRGGTRLYDVGTGKLLLHINNGDWATGLAFSRNGESLAVSCTAAIHPGEVFVVDLEYGRGIQTLRGLSNQVEKVAFSPDDRLLAALSHDSRVAVWDRRRDHLLHVFDAPKAL